MDQVVDRVQHETPESEHSLLSKPLYDVWAVGYCFSHVDMLVSQSDSSRWKECLIDLRHLIMMMVPKSDSYRQFSSTYNVLRGLLLLMTA